MTPQETISATKDEIGGVGASFYFHPDTLARGKELGLDGFRFYVLGRGGVLGDVEPSVITSAFGYFAPEVITKIWNSGRSKVSPREAATAYLECCRDRGRSALGDVEGLDGFCEAAEVVVNAAHPAGLALFAGYRDEPLPDDIPARAMQLAATLRELRGSVHLLAVVASEVPPAVAHAIRRPEMLQSFGYQESPTITDEDRSKLDTADELTDRLLVPAYEPLSDSHGEALVSGARSMAAALGV